MTVKTFTHYLLPLAFSIVVYALSLGLVALSISMESTLLTVLSLIFTATTLFAVVFFLVEFRKQNR